MYGFNFVEFSALEELSRHGGYLLGPKSFFIFCFMHVLTLYYINFFHISFHKSLEIYKQVLLQCFHKYDIPSMLKALFFSLISSGMSFLEHLCFFC